MAATMDISQVNWSTTDGQGTVSKGAPPWPVPRPRARPPVHMLAHDHANYHITCVLISSVVELQNTTNTVLPNILDIIWNLKCSHHAICCIDNTDLLSVLHLLVLDSDLYVTKMNAHNDY